MIDEEDPRGDWTLSSSPSWWSMYRCSSSSWREYRAKSSCTNYEGLWSVPRWTAKNAI